MIYLKRRDETRGNEKRRDKIRQDEHTRCEEMMIRDI